MWVFHPAPSPAAPESAHRPAPSEQEFHYDIQFLFFKRAAQGFLRLRRTGENQYRGDLFAETKGLVGALTFYQRNHYVSEMEYLPREGRLLSRRFTKTITRGRKTSRGVIEVDYAKGELRWRNTEDERVEDEGSETIPEATVYEDILSAFFNLRSGAYGPITRGRHLALVTLPTYQRTKEGEVKYEEEFVRIFDVRIADAPKEREYRKRFDRSNEKGLLALVQVPKEIFGQETGEVRIWLDSSFIPVAATVEDAYWLGDVHGFLRKAIVAGRVLVDTPP